MEGVTTVPCLLLLFFLVAGCAAALQRDARCLAALTPDYLLAAQQLTPFEQSWFVLGVRPPPLLLHFQPAPILENQSTHHSLGYDYHAPDKKHYHETLQWYSKIYTRLRTRLEEERILSEALMILITGPGIVFYPIIRWNLRSVLWDGENPDAPTDPINRYCSARLSERSTVPD